MGWTSRTNEGRMTGKEGRCMEKRRKRRNTWSAAPGQIFRDLQRLESEGERG